MDAVGPSGVVAGGDNPALIGSATDCQRYLAQRRVIAHLDSGVEAVAIDMQNLAAHRHTPVELSQSLTATAANDSNTDTFDLQCLMAQVQLNGSEVGVLRFKCDAVPLALKAFNRDFILQAGHDDLAVTHMFGAVYGQQVTFENAYILHRQPAHLEQVVGTRRKEIR